MTDTRTAQTRLNHGAEFPYDAPDADEATPSPARDWAHAAARGVIAELTDRHTIKRGFEEVDHDIRVELVATLADIIRLAARHEIEKGLAAADIAPKPGAAS